MKLDKITSIRLYEGSNEKLQHLANLRGLDKADVLRQAVKSYLDQYNLPS
ncbi:ribbon-helix-helix domain-containing protein [Anabaena sp. AL09]|jgi:predicted DNA-binding protein|nr:ribbon-helix-helix domain-containing protein [Anabaena sp. AL09]MBJ7296930.1 CopG family transcriptional regulator [Dolichospermum sp.]